MDYQYQLLYLFTYFPYDWHLSCIGSLPPLVTNPSAPFFHHCPITVWLEKLHSLKIIPTQIYGREGSFGLSQELFVQITEAGLYVFKFQEEALAVEGAWKTWLVAVSWGGAKECQRYLALCLHYVGDYVEYFIFCYRLVLRLLSKTFLKIKLNLSVPIFSLYVDPPLTVTINSINNRYYVR